MVDRKIWQMYQTSWELRTKTTNAKRELLTDDDIKRCKLLKDAIGVRGKVLDVGCGNGWFRSRQAKDVGIDYIDSRNEIIGLDPASLNDEDRFKVVKGFGEDIPFGDNTFDVVVCRSVLDHTRDYVRVIKECYRVLKYGCCFYGESAVFFAGNVHVGHTYTFSFDSLYMPINEMFSTVTMKTVGGGKKYCHLLWEAVK